MFADLGVSLIAIGLVLDAWFSPPLPRFSIPVLGLFAIFMMQISKLIREKNGIIIPDTVVTAAESIANVEAALSFADGVCVMAILAMEILRISVRYQQVATVGTLVLFAITFIFFRFTRKRFYGLMKAQSIDLALD
jgi:hypothetical protein